MTTPTTTTQLWQPPATCPTCGYFTTWQPDRPQVAGCDRCTWEASPLDVPERGASPARQAAYLYHHARRLAQGPTVYRGKLAHLLAHAAAERLPHCPQVTELRDELRDEAQRRIGAMRERFGPDYVARRLPGIHDRAEHAAELYLADLR